MQYVLTPLEEYQQRQQFFENHRKRYEQYDTHCANIRLVLFLSGVFLGFLGLRNNNISLYWTLIPAVLFFVLVIVHDRVLRQKKRYSLLSNYYMKGLKRLHEEWAGQGESGKNVEPEEHPAAHDLDVFGKGSLFERLCTARTVTGQQTLADWLCTPVDAETIRQRQEAVRELAPLLELRENLALLGTNIKKGVHPKLLHQWRKRPGDIPTKKTRLAIHLLSASNLLTLILGIATGFLAPFILSLLCGVLLLAATHKKNMAVLKELDEPMREINLLLGLIQQLENRPFKTPLLQQWQQALRSEEQSAASAIAHLDRLYRLAELPRNQLFMPVALVLLWPLRFRCHLEAWRATWGPALASWLEAAGNLEALCAVAGYAFENPKATYPEILEGGPLLNAIQLGHPLLPQKTCMCNDISLNQKCPAWIVSGSNMSGKSTFLRTIGISLILARTGAPVRAQQLQTTPMAIAATLRIHDSIQRGASRFFAEITRLKTAMDIADGPFPLLFLCDEILHGTNSHDRAIGAEAIVRAFIQKNALGLITTHDLSITQFAQALHPKVRNVHFADHFDKGTLDFDYTLHDGVVEHSNALNLMRSVGLCIE